MSSMIRKAIAGTALIGATAFAQEPQEKPFIRGGSVSTSLESNYTGSSYGMAFGDNPVVQSYAEAKLPNDFAVGVWNNYDSGLNRKHAFNEIDVVVSGKLPIDRIGISSDYSASLTGIHLQFPNAGLHSATTATLSLSKKGSPISLDIHKLWGKDSQQGYAAKLTYADSAAMTSKTNFNYSLALLANSHAFTKDTDLSVVMGKIGLEHKFNDKTSVNIGIRHQVPVDKFNGTFSRRTTWNVGLSHTF